MGLITISFDDCFSATVDSCAGFLRRKGIRATFAAPAGFIGGSRKGDRIAGAADLAALLKDGHEIASHSLSHENLMDTIGLGGEDAVRHELEASRKTLETIPGCGVSSFVFPYIENNCSSLLRSLASEYYSSSRTTSVSHFFNRLPVKDPHSLTGTAFTSCSAPREMEELVDTVAGRDLWLIEVFHLVSEKNTVSPERESPYRFFTPVEVFRSHVEYILSKGIPVMTQGEAVSSGASR